MDLQRRKFLQMLGGAYGAGLAQTLGFGAVASTAAAAATPLPAAAAASPFAAGAYGSGVRQQVFEVIVRQAVAGAPWREICAGPMRVNNICAEDVEREVARRLKFLNQETLHKECNCDSCTDRHVEDRKCFCSRCNERRSEEHKAYVHKLASIPHSEVSPCACNNCMEAITKHLGKIREETFRT